MGAFHAYDIRGLWGEDIDLEFARRLGYVFGSRNKGAAVLIAHDARLHSAELEDTLAAGLMAGGCKVTSIGLASTPQLHFYQMRSGSDIGIMVTASHNPKDYHGFKFFDRQGGSISYDKGLKEIEKLMPKTVVPPAGQAEGSVRRERLIDEYVDFIARRAGGKKLTRPVVIDASNGSAGAVVEALVARLGLKGTLLHTRPDGNFPHHDPNPLKEASRREAQRKVVETKAALGAVLDGDGDRIIFLDEQGAGVENYFMSALIAEELLKSAPGAAIVYDLISSRVLPEHIENSGGRPVMSKVGYTFLYDKMVEHRAAFGAETSGHVYFKVDERYYTESALYALVIVLAFLEGASRPLSQLLAPLRGRYFQAPELNLPAGDKARALAAIEESFRDGEVSRIDGVSVAYGDFWFNVRPSNTEPLLRVRLEARDRDTARRRIEQIEKIIAGVR